MNKLISHVMLSVALGGLPANAAFYTVTGTADNTDAVAHGGSGTSGSPFQMSSLRGAIIAANALAGPDTITLPAGPYTLTIPNTGNVNEDACLQGDLDVTDSLVINGAGAASTIVQAGTTVANGIDKVFAINPFCNHAIAFAMSGVTVRFGRNTQANGATDFSFTGGGIDFCGNGASTCTLRDCVIANNSNVNGYGGGMNIDEVAPATSVVTLTNTVFANNTSALWGGGINVFGDDVQVTISACTISGNQTAGAAGAGAQGGGVNIRITGSTAGTTPFVTLNNGSMISNNVAKGFGGGVCAAGSGNQNVTIQNSSLIGNVVLNNGAISSEGGGLYHDGALSKTTTLNNVVIANNHSDTSGGAGAEAPEGGGILVGSGVVKLTGNCIITNNTAGNGAGIFNRTASASLSMTGGLVANNQAKTNGGGIYVSAGTVALTNLTVSANSATSSGGGLFVGGGSLSMIYSRIVGNTAANAIGLAESAGAANVSNNWWGLNAPATLMSGTVNFTPWLMLTHTANPNTISPPNSTTLTATFLTNSAGTFIPVANLSPLIGLPITFNNPQRGTLSAAQTTIQASGSATATFTANAVGAGSADALVDNQTSPASITILCPSISAVVSGGGTVCPGNAAVVTVTLSGGTPPYSVTLNNGGGIRTGSSPLSFTNSPASTTLYSISSGSDANACAVTASGSATISLLVDTTPPVITCSTNITVSAFGYCPVAVDFNVSATDNCTLSNLVTTPPSGSAFSVGTNTVAVVATDAAGNTNTCSFKVIVLPGPRPQLTVERVGTNAVLSWPTLASCYSLQFTSTLVSSPATNQWTVYAGPLVTNAGTIFVTNSPGNANRFYRLAY